MRKLATLPKALSGVLIYAMVIIFLLLYTMCLYLMHDFYPWLFCDMDKYLEYTDGLPLPDVNEQRGYY